MIISLKYVQNIVNFLFCLFFPTQVSLLLSQCLLSMTLGIRICFWTSFEFVDVITSALIISWYADTGDTCIYFPSFTINLASIFNYHFFNYCDVLQYIVGLGDNSQIEKGVFLVVSRMLMFIVYWTWGRASTLSSDSVSCSLGLSSSSRVTFCLYILLLIL